jgi:hypothetical protein
MSHASAHASGPLRWRRRRHTATSGSAPNVRVAGACLGLRRGVFPARRSSQGGGRAVPSRRAPHPVGRGLDGFVSPPRLAGLGRKEAPTLRVVLSRKHAFAGQLAPQRVRGWGSPSNSGDGTPGPRACPACAGHNTEASARGEGVEGCRRGPAIGPQPTAQDRLFYEIVSRGGCRGWGHGPEGVFLIL